MATTTTARTTKARTTRAKTAPAKAAPKKPAPKRAAAKPRTTRPRTAPKAEEAPMPATETKDAPSLAGAYKMGMDFMEGTVTGVLSMPLSVMSTLGVPENATDAARDTQQAMAKGFHGAFDGVVNGLTGLVGKAPGVLGGMMSSATKLLP